MKKFTKFFILSICYLFTITCANANSRSCISKNDITNLIDSFKQKKDILLSDGEYIDIDATDIITKDALYKEINNKGYMKLFPNKISYHFFLQYLKKLATNPNLFIDKDLTYNEKDVIYIFTLSCHNEKALIQLNTSRYIKDFGNSESAYMYYFKKINNQIYLLKMNVAG